MLACFFRSARGPSPAEEAYVDGVEKSRRTTIKRQRRPIMEARQQPWNPFAGACKPPARITFADRCGPGSLEAFLESVVAARGGGGGGSTSHDVPGNRWAEIAEAKARRQRYLRDYCPFQSGEEEEISAHTAPDDDEQQQEEISAPTAAPEKTTEEAEVIDHAVVKQPAANCPGPEGGDDDATGVRDKQARPVRGTAGYYVMRQEFLKSYQLARKRRTFREKAPLLPVFRRLLPRRKKAQIL
ncbi:hypothetical protein E2562_030103 [Oryza meyeriana var. granulata]|uniref:Uncharacterized protein n=1 Tax=Oryza meyeriana var. granulata TaxID=110450 RepID=A0A6G1CV56_9ORYZ|nr:hypothetical protein E2562_030103 [Oryza meyeriana var. granulata]